MQPLKDARGLPRGRPTQLSGAARLVAARVQALGPAPHGTPQPRPPAPPEAATRVKAMQDQCLTAATETSRCPSNPTDGNRSSKHFGCSCQLLPCVLADAAITVGRGAPLQHEDFHSREPHRLQANFFPFGASHWKEALRPHTGPCASSDRFIAGKDQRPVETLRARHPDRVPDLGLTRTRSHWENGCFPRQTDLGAKPQNNIRMK